jgi:tRNA modification GTPase
VERIGVEKSRKVINEADLVLLVLNNSEALSDEDKKLMALVEGVKSIIIVNKTDLEQRIDLEEVKRLQPGKSIISTSLKEEEGIQELEQSISELYFSGNLEADDMTYVSNVRHINLLRLAKSSIGDAIGAIELGVPIDIAQIDIQKTWELLGEIIGDAVSESLIDQLFSQFCLGK